jgi:hypothetical protein
MLIFLQTNLLVVDFFYTPCFFSLIHVTSRLDDFLCLFPIPASRSAVFPAKPDLVPDHPAAGRTVLADLPNWYSECQFGASPEWTDGPPNCSAYGPVPPNLSPNWLAYINSWGGLQICFSPLLLLPTPAPISMAAASSSFPSP